MILVQGFILIKDTHQKPFRKGPEGLLMCPCKLEGYGQVKFASTRRFLVFPALVLLSAIGLEGP